MPAIRLLLARHRWTVAVGLAFIAGSFVLPLPPLPIPPWHPLQAAGLGLASLSFAVAFALWRRRPVYWSRLPGVVLACVGASAFLDAFMRWKAWLGLVRGVEWDPRLIHWSVVLHGGHPLGVWLLPLFGSPPVLHFLDAAYYLWFPVMAAVILWQAWSDDRERAARFALAFVLTWAGLGVAAAGLCFSLGPIFLPDPGPFRPVVAAMLAAPPAGTMETRDMLWHYWTTLGVSSIAAMPSIHVALPTLYACVARGWLRLLFACYALVIFLGSVMLAWHYAVDGYVAVLGVLAIWWLAARRPQPPHVPSNASRI